VCEFVMRIDNVGRQVFVAMGIFFFPPSRPPLRGPSDDHAFCLRELRSKQTKELHILHTYQDCLVVALRPDFRGEKLKAIGMLKKWSKHGTMCAAGYLSAIIQCQGGVYVGASVVQDGARLSQDVTPLSLLVCSFPLSFSFSFSVMSERHVFFL
jgi:hypothetical protein